MRLVLLLLLFVLISCGKKEKDPRTLATTDPIFHNYIQDFEVAYRNHFNSDIFTGHVPINFTDIDSNSVGLCLSYSSGYREILIDETFWNSTDEIYRELIVFHEIGHCVLGYEHKDKPNRIMHKYIPNSTDYFNNRSQYLKYFFNNN